MKNIVIFGASGTIGQAMITTLSQQYPQAFFMLGSRQNKRISSPKNSLTFQFDLKQEETITQARDLIKPHGPIDLILITTGVLTVHHKQHPEKAMRDLSVTDLQEYFLLNTIGPALIGKSFLPLLSKEKKAVFAALSAKVGSISQNYLGGWYGYRASKAALNMMLKSLAIETKRKNPHAVILGLHPGTVDSPLSAPYQKGLPAGQLSTAQQAAIRLCKVIQAKQSKDSGGFFNWDGEELSP